MSFRHFLWSALRRKNGLGWGTYYYIRQSPKGTNRWGICVGNIPSIWDNKAFNSKECLGDIGSILYRLIFVRLWSISSYKAWENSYRITVDLSSWCLDHHFWEFCVFGHHDFLRLFTVKLTKGEKSGTQVNHLGANHILKCSPCLIATWLFPHDQR